jgi:hypothetical protein
MSWQHEFNPLRESKSKSNGVKFHALLTTPELAMMDIAHLEPIPWAMIAADNAHRRKIKKTMSCIGIWSGFLRRIGHWNSTAVFNGGAMGNAALL